MQVIRHAKQLEIILFEPEAYLLRHSLSEIIRNYQMDCNELPVEVQKIWFNTDSMQDEEDRELWAEQLRDFRGQNSKLAKRILQELESSKTWPAVIHVDLQEAETLMIIINDHRLYLAAVNNVGEQEMDVEWDQISDSLSRNAVMNIHFLAWLIELILHRLGEPL